MTEHILPAWYLEQPVSVTLAGCGGNGSQMLTGLARLDHALRGLGHPGLEVTAYDPDTVGAANIGRQLFSASDVGLNKAVVLVHRINAFFGLDWRAIPAAAPAVSKFEWRSSVLVITCVDSRRARATIDRSCRAGAAERPMYWLDLGNREADGQVVLGQWDSRRMGDQPIEQPRLPTALELFPEIADTSLPEDDAPSCSLAEALERQELFINQAVVTQALAILWALFRFGRIGWHGAFVNLRTGRTTPLPVDPQTWGRMGYVPTAAAKKRGRKNQ